jgi:hypothetical protein
MKLLAAILLLATTTAHAGLYEERQAVANERARAARTNEQAAGLSAEFAQQARLVQGFVARLGGAANGSCSGYEFSCYNGSCGQGALVKIPVHALGSGPYYFAGCSVTLNDGQACVINQHLSTVTWNYEGLVAYCYDANSERHVYHYPGRVGSAKKPVRRKR